MLDLCWSIPVSLCNINKTREDVVVLSTFGAGFRRGRPALNILVWAGVHFSIILCGLCAACERQFYFRGGYALLMIVNSLTGQTCVVVVLVSSLRSPASKLACVAFQWIRVLAKVAVVLIFRLRLYVCMYVTYFARQ